LKTDEPASDARSARPKEGPAVNGVAHARDNEQHEGDGAASGPSLADLPPVGRSQTLRLLYWLVWFGALPVLGACAFLWLFAPPLGVDASSSAVGAVQSLVHAQPVPVGIVVFTLFEIVLWAVRHQLPFARHAHPPLRSDLPQKMRGDFERARGLLDEAEAILARHDKAVVRDLTAKERDRLRADLGGLRQAMARVPFDEEAFTSAFAKADGEVDVRLSRWRKSETREYLEAILMAVAVAFALRAFVIEAFKIPSGSMIPTLMVGDHIFVNKFSYGPAIPYTHSRVWTNMPPHRGDVMVFAFPEHPEQDFIKRVVAIPGDKLEARSGHPFINGWEVPSCRIGAWSYADYDSSISRHDGDLYMEYLGTESFLTFYDRASGAFPENQGPFQVKEGEAWVMGDNRNNSHDSRMWFGGQGGGVPFENIRGRALFVWLSIPDTGVDWSREGIPVMGRPHLPPTASALRADFDRCLASRPAVTDPPPPSP
jgi:signal peptidase I